MVFRFKGHFRRRIVALLCLGALTAVLAFVYCLFLFVSFEDNPLAEGFIGRLVDDIATEQVLSSLQVGIEVDPAQSMLKGHAAMSFTLPRIQGHIVLRHLLLYLPTDLIFYLHPDFTVDEVRWGDRFLDVKQIQSRIFVDLAGARPPDGGVLLDVRYSGRIDGSSGSSRISPDKFYLDSKDGFYPYLDADDPCPVGIDLKAPMEFKILAPEDAVITGREGEVSANHFAFSEPVPLFSLAASTSEPRRLKVENTLYTLYAWDGSQDRLSETLSDIHRFYGARLPPPRFHELRLLTSDSEPAGGPRCDETGTILMPPQFAEEELAFVTAFYWIGKLGGRRGEALFTRTEIARALSLNYLQIRKGDPYYAQKLLESIDPAPGRARDVAAGPGRTIRRPGEGAFLLSILRRMTGDDAFDEILRRVLSGSGGEDMASWRLWNEEAVQVTGEDLEWFFRRWAEEGRTLDLAVDRFTVDHLAMGYKVILDFKNNGTLSFPEKIKALFITETGSVAKMLPIRRSRTTFTDYFQDPVIGVVLDPDLDWYDQDRSNNLVYLDAPPYRVMPSKNNRYLAVAYSKRAEEERYPFVVFETDGEDRHVYLLDHPVGRIEWIHENRLIIRNTVQDFDGPYQGTAGSHYLIDILSNQTERFPNDAELTASFSGRYLLINERIDNLWQHKLKDLKRNVTRRVFHRIPFPLTWVPGTDLIIPRYPETYHGDVEILQPEGQVAYPFIESDSRLYGFQGFEEGLAFLRKKDDKNYFYTIRSPAQEPRRVTEIGDLPLSFHLLQYGGIIHFRESLPEDRIRITSYDPAHDSKTVLFEGSAKGLYDVYSDKGLLIRRTRNGSDGRVQRDIYFHPFGEKEGKFITDSPAPERILALVGNQRYLYYAEELKVHWSSLSVFNRYRFYCYDFLNREVRELDFENGAP